MGQLTQFLGALPPGRKISLFVLFFLSLFGFGLLIFWNNTPDYQVLFSNLSQEDAGEMVNKLKERKIPYKISNHGGTLLVPQDQVYELRLSLVSEGLPKGGGIGFEVFDRTNLGTTDFVQKLNFQRALQGELIRTIRQIKEVEQVRVHIVTPKESLFVEEQKKPTASVLIKMRSGMALGPAQVEGIVHLVASAVEGLEPGNITVVDTSGKILFKRNDTNPVGQLTTTQLEYQRTLEEGMKRKVQGMLEEVLGPGKAIARISTDLDFEQVDITEERYDPNTVIRSEQKQAERSSSGIGVPHAGEPKGEGQPDPKGGKAKAGESGRSTQAGSHVPSTGNHSERQQEVRNYEISRINKHIKSPVGRVKKVSLAVIVDGAYKEVTDPKGKKERQYAARTPEEMKNLESIVKRAVGYDEKRGDEVEVINMPFNWSTGEEEVKGEKGTPWKDYLLVSLKPGVSLILALLFIFFIVRPFMKKKVFAPETGQVALLESPPQPVIRPEAPQAVEAPRISDPRDRMAQLIRQDPSKAAGIVKAWLREEG